MSDLFPIQAPVVDAQGADLTQYSVQLAFNTLTAAVRSALNQLAGGSFPPSGAAGGDLSGTYPNPTVSTVHATAGTIDGVTIGGLVPEPGSFTALAATSLTGLTTPLSVPQGGTGGTTQAAARTGIAAAASGANSDITSLTGLTTPLSVAQGGTARTSIPAHNIPVGNGASQVGLIVPGASGTILGSTGATTDPSFQTATALGLTGTASPAFTGTPTAPTAALHTSTTQIATTAFVENEFASPPALGSTTPAAVSATTVSATGAITPSQTAGIVGTTTNNNASAGSIGEFQSNSTTGTALTTATPGNATSITSLPAGDWEVTGVATFTPAGTTTMNQVEVGISTTSATFPAANTGGFILDQSTAMPTGGLQVRSAPMVRLSLAVATNVFLVAQAQFAISTMSVGGFIRARRVR